jgi:pheromone a factor receptor
VVCLIYRDAEFFVSSYRYQIVENFGPWYSTDYTVVAIFLVIGWPVVIGNVSFVYCGTRVPFPSSFTATHSSTAMTIYHLVKRKRQFNEIMSSNRGLNQSRYIRLMMLASCDMLITTPLSTYFMAWGIKRIIQLGNPSYSWARLRHNYSHIPEITSIQLKANPAKLTSAELTRWSVVVCAFIFFAFFGFADEAWIHYRRVYTSLARRVGYSTSSGTLTGSSHAYVVRSKLCLRLS